MLQVITSYLVPLLRCTLNSNFNNNNNNSSISISNTTTNSSSNNNVADSIPTVITTITMRGRIITTRIQINKEVGVGDVTTDNHEGEVGVGTVTKTRITAETGTDSIATITATMMVEATIQTGPRLHRGEQVVACLYFN